MSTKINNESGPPGGIWTKDLKINIARNVTKVPTENFPSFVFGKNETAILSIPFFLLHPFPVRRPSGR